MELPAESREILEIVVYSLSSFFYIYKKLGPTKDFFIDVMRRRKKIVMGLNKWAEVSKRVTKENEKSMFNFK